MHTYEIKAEWMNEWMNERSQEMKQKPSPLHFASIASIVQRKGRGTRYTWRWWYAGNGIVDIGGDGAGSGGTGGGGSKCKYIGGLRTAINRQQNAASFSHHLKIYRSAIISPIGYCGKVFSTVFFLLIFFVSKFSTDFSFLTLWKILSFLVSSLVFHFLSSCETFSSLLFAFCVHFCFFLYSKWSFVSFLWAFPFADHKTHQEKN